ncbi:hypothetical protein BV25DRAFT_1995275 [Artomyces pyxidatus]|uniref:Uncharacterized protein n=1 Tax=Artomyces pyxidatus TaxID=48021 RepID=A0ACB8SKH4_9AGAM|nr:hypothetical protein BV25DRAFT_1995275 [Artomyces pyxidatus]
MVDSIWTPILNMRTDYTPISQDDGMVEKQPATPAKTSAIVRWSTLIILLCTAVDVLLVFTLLFHGKADIFFSAPADPASPSALEMPSTYISFDLLYDGTVQRNHTMPPIVNLPRTINQVSSLQPSTVFPQWPESWLTVYGIVPINNRRLWVSSDISTIVQFRVLDYGMENCSLALTIPAAGHGEAHLAVSELHEDKAHLDVWALSASTKLDLQTLSWQTRPSRAAHIGRLSASYNQTHQLPSFSCRSGSYQTFELSCAGSGCGIDVTALSQNDVGLYMLQYQTK